MSNLFCLPEAQMERLRLFFRRAMATRVDNRRTLNGIVSVNRNGWR